MLDSILLMVSLIKNLNVDLDINECEISNGGCEHQCENTNGSYICECNKGFSLDGNGKTCTGKFENKMDAEVLLRNNMNTGLFKETVRLKLSRTHI